jgi:hypothetical protein
MYNLEKMVTTILQIMYSKVNLLCECRGCGSIWKWCFVTIWAHQLKPFSCLQGTHGRPTFYASLELLTFKGYFSKSETLNEGRKNECQRKLKSQRLATVLLSLLDFHPSTADSIIPQFFLHSSWLLFFLIL